MGVLKEDAQLHIHMFLNHVCTHTYIFVNHMYAHMFLNVQWTPQEASIGTKPLQKYQMGIKILVICTANTQGRKSFSF